MGLALFKERRFAERRKLTGLLPGRLQLTASGSDLVCRPVDVSANGMGVVAARELQAGAELVLRLRDRDVALQVAWSQPDFGKHDMFRYGLVTVNPEDNIEALFIAAGCLR